MMLIPGVLQARFVREEKRIEYLLQAVASLKGAVFIRNGNDYDAKTAGSHLRLKLKYEGDRVQTAEDFIEICASRSSLTGNAYQIRLADGTIIPATTFFRAQLRLFDDIHKKVPVQPVPI